MEKIIKTIAFKKGICYNDFFKGTTQYYKPMELNSMQKTTLDITLRHKKIWVMGLIFKCPLGESKEDCPAKNLRGRPLDELEKIGESMEEAELDEIIFHHKQCMENRGY